MIRRLLVVVFLVALPLHAQALTLKIATISPDGTTWMKELRKGAGQIRQRTAGRVRFRFYPGGVMGNDQTVLRKIRIGQLHGGAFTGGGLEQIYFDSQIYSLPFAFRSYEEVDYVRSHMDDLILQGLYRHGFVGFGLAEGGFAYLMSDRPIRRSGDLRDHKVWVPEGDRMSQLIFNAAGISPVPLPLPDVLTGLQTGLIDTVGTSPIGALALQWHTRVKYVTDIPLMYLYGLLIVDRRVFERLSPDDQAVVREVMRDVFRRLDRLNREENTAARQALVGQGISFVAPSAADRSRWEAIIATAIDRLGGDGFFSRSMLETLQHHLDEFRNSQTASRNR